MAIRRLFVATLEALRAAAADVGRASSPARAGLLLIALVISSVTYSVGRSHGTVSRVVVERPVSVPGPIVTKEIVVERSVPGPVVTKEVTPKSCIEALDLSGQAFGLAGEAVSILNEALQAAGRQDAVALRNATVRFQANTVKVQDVATRMGAPSADCRSRAN